MKPFRKRYTSTMYRFLFADMFKILCCYIAERLLRNYQRRYEFEIGFSHEEQVN